MRLWYVHLYSVFFVHASELHRGIKYVRRLAYARLLFGSHETSPILWVGKSAPAIQCQLSVERWHEGAKHWARNSKRLRSPGIDSQSGSPVRQPYLTYRPARLHRLAESMELTTGLCKRFTNSGSGVVTGGWGGVKTTDSKIHWLCCCSVLPLQITPTHSLPLQHFVSGTILIILINF